MKAPTQQQIKAWNIIQELLEKAGEWKREKTTTKEHNRVNELTNGKEKEGN